MRTLAERIEDAHLPPAVAKTFANALLELAGADGETTGDEHELVAMLLADATAGSGMAAPFESLWPHADLFLTACVYLAVVDGHYGVEEARRLSDFAHRLGFSAHQLAQVEGRAFRELRQRGALARNLKHLAPSESEFEHEPATEVAQAWRASPDDDTQGFETSDGELVDEVPLPELEDSTQATFEELADDEVTQASLGPPPVIPPPPMLPDGPRGPLADAIPPLSDEAEDTLQELTRSGSRAVRWSPPRPEPPPPPPPPVSAAEQRRASSRSTVFRRPPPMPLVTGTSPLDPPPRLMARPESEESEKTEVTAQGDEPTR